MHAFDEMSVAGWISVYPSPMFCPRLLHMAVSRAICILETPQHLRTRLSEHPRLLRRLTRRQVQILGTFDR